MKAKITGPSLQMTGEFTHAGFLINLLRRHLGKSQKDVGYVSTINQAKMTRLERGKQDITYNELESILSAMGYELELTLTKREGADE